MYKLEIRNINDNFYKNLERITTDGTLDNKKIVIYGDYRTSEHIMGAIYKAGYEIAKVVDPNSRRNESVKQGIISSFNGYLDPVNLEDYLVPHNDDIILILATREPNKAYRRLEKLGYYKQQIVEVEDFKEVYRLASIPMVSEDKLYSVSEMKKREFEILCAWDDYCNKEGLRHYLAFGTLLGAIRHKGFIPWDDDIDVFMPIEDYNKFMRDFKHEYYVAYNINNTDNFYHTLGRLVDTRTVLEDVKYPFKAMLGVNIDIFPVCGFPEDENVAEFTSEVLNNSKDWDNLWYNYQDSDEWRKRYRAVADRINDTMVRYNYDSSGKRGCFLSGKVDTDVYPAEVFDETVMVSFEGREFPTVRDYDRMLTIKYGDYMALPSEQERTLKHTFIVYDK